MNQPKLTVKRRKYRFRLINAGPSRFYQFFLTKENVDQTFKHIGNDESLLEQPVDVTSVLLAVAERGDIIIDFSLFKKNDQLLLVNRLVMRDDGTGPDFDPDADGNFVNFKVLPAAPNSGDQILQFIVGDDAMDRSRVPAKLRENPPLPKWTEQTPDQLKNLKNHKQFEFSNEGLIPGQWVINFTAFETSPSTLIRQNPLPGDEIESPPGKMNKDNRRADGEVWTIRNAGDATWSHPIHISR